MTRAVTFCPTFSFDVGKVPMGTSSKIWDAWMWPISLSRSATMTKVGLTDFTVPVTISPKDRECFIMADVSSSVLDSRRNLATFLLFFGLCTASKNPWLPASVVFRTTMTDCPTFIFSESNRNVSLKWEAKGMAINWPVSSKEATAYSDEATCCTTAGCWESAVTWKTERWWLLESHRKQESGTDCRDPET